MNEPRARVRVVDPDPELAGAIAALLRDAGFDPTTRRDEEPACDLVVVGLPAASDLSPRIDPEAPIVLMRAARLAFGVIEEWVLDRPGFAILEKPVSPAALLHMVRSLLDARAKQRPDAVLPWEP